MKILPALVFSLAAFTTACTTAPDGGDDGPDPGPVEPIDPVSLCGFDSDRYLPFEAGQRWSYTVTKVDTGERKVKAQHLEAGADGTVVQITEKLDGSTRSVLRVDGDRVVRLQQEDIDGAGAVEKTTTYAPGQIRIDEADARIVTGASWEEIYDELVSEAGSAPTTVRTRDLWDVVAAETPCNSALGDFTCLHLRRARAEGGVAIKEFWFARGIGKIREVGDKSVEELASCSR
jgi:hypothetical protein